MTTTPTPRAAGRFLFLAGAVACLLGPLLVAAQFGYLKRPVMPWYSPALAALGAAFIVAALVRRASLLRFVALATVLAMAGLQFFALASLRLPAYDGPAKEGERLPKFSAVYADGRSFSDGELRDGSRRVMVFFRGRW